MFGSGLSKEEAKKIFDEKQKALLVDVKREIKTSLIAIELNLEQVFDDKLSLIADSVQAIKETTVINLTDELQETLKANNNLVATAISTLSKNLVKLEGKIDLAVNDYEKTKDEINERIQDTNARLDAFIDVISGKIAEVGKKAEDVKKNTKPLTEIFASESCPFDNRIESCEVWKNRIEINDAPAFCSACRSAAMLHKKGLSNVRIRQITTGNS